MLRSLYDWTLSLAEHPRAIWVLAFVAFIESSVFPIPVALMVIPMVIARPNQAFWIAFVTMAFSVLGGLFGYAIGAFAYDSIGQPILEALGKADRMEEFNTKFNNVGFWAVLTAGITPFPYKVITIMSGWTGMPVATFIVTSMIARSIQFFSIATLLYFFGPPIRSFIEKRLGLVFAALLAVVIGGIYLVKFL